MSGSPWGGAPPVAPQAGRNAVWAYRILLVLALPALGLLGLLVASALPGALATGSEDLPGVLAWAGVLALGVLLVPAAMLVRRRGRPGVAAGMLALIVLPAAVGIGILLFIVLLFILKS